MVSLQELEAAIEKELPDICWLTKNAEVRCMGLIGAEIGSNGTSLGRMTREMCCLPCRIRIVLSSSRMQQVLNT